MIPYHIVYRDRPSLVTGQIVRKFLRRPLEDGGLWNWTKKIKRAARFLDATQAEAYAEAYTGAEIMRISETALGKHGGPVETS